MSNNLVGAFNAVVDAQARDVEIERYNKFPAKSIRLANSNYTRDIQSIEDTSITGREFIITQSSIEGSDYDPPKKGDLLRDPKLGTNTITFVKEMVILGAISGYRVRTS